MISAAPVLVNMPNLNAATLVPLNDNNNQEFVSLDSDTETTTNPLLENQNYSKETETKFFRTRQGALEAGENVKLADKGIEKAIDEYIESRDDENACDNHYFKVNIDPIRGQSLDEVKAKLIELGVQKALINKPIPGTSEGEGIENLTKLNAGIVRAEVFEGKDGQEQIKSVIISAPFLVDNAQKYLETENSDTIYNEYTRQPLTQKESVVIPNQYLDRGISGDTVRELLTDNRLEDMLPVYIEKDEYLDKVDSSIDTDLDGIVWSRNTQAQLEKAGLEVTRDENGQIQVFRNEPDGDKVELIAFEENAPKDAEAAKSKSKKDTIIKLGAESFDCLIPPAIFEEGKKEGAGGGGAAALLGGLGAVGLGPLWNPGGSGGGLNLNFGGDGNNNNIPTIVPNLEQVIPELVKEDESKIDFNVPVDFDNPPVEKEPECLDVKVPGNAGGASIDYESECRPENQTFNTQWNNFLNNRTKTPAEKAMDESGAYLRACLES